MSIFLLFLSLSTPSAPAYDTYRVSEEPIGCSKMVEEFCDHLWAPKNLGNIDLKIGSRAPREIRLGRRPNEYTTAYYNWAKRVIAARIKLPADFRRPLERMQYFPLLERSLRRKPNQQMNAQQIYADRRLFAQIEAIWNSARDEAVFARMEPVHPHFYQLTNDSIPQSSWLKLNEFVDRLDAEINVALLSGSPEWKSAEEAFRTIREDYIAEIHTHPRLSPETKQIWEERLRSVRLEIPGSNPETLDSNGRSCAKTESNAFYSPSSHAITVCAGFFNGIELTHMLAHELSHALAIRRTTLMHKQASPVAALLTQLHERTCKATSWSCDDWNAFKDKYRKAAASLGQAEIPNEKYFACFRKRTLSKEKPDKEFLDFLTHDRVNNQIEYLASHSWFLQLSEPKEILRNGAIYPNPRYLNPCGFYWTQPKWENLINPESVSSFFVQEFQCQKGTPPERMEKAITLAKELSAPLIKSEMQVAGPFAPDRDFERKGFSEDIEEDFADAMAGEVFSRVLQRQKSLSAKRTLMLASLAQLCDQPSLEKQFPDEAAVQKKFYFEPHSEGIERRQRLLTPRIRKELQCNRDFRSTIKDCD